jgi:hypothetical protein
MKRFITPLAVAAGGLLVGHFAADRAVDHYLLHTPFNLIDVYRAGMVWGIVGGVIAAGIVAALARPERHAQAALIRLLEAQTGRGDLTNDQRAALAYVAQDLRDSVSKQRHSKGFRTFVSR